MSAFRNAEGETLQTDVYREVYFTPEGLKWGDRELYLADALVLYRGEAVNIQPGNNQAFYVEVRSVTDQTPGVYYATITYSDELGVIGEKAAAAYVWDFALPQQHYASMSLGIYNVASGYGATSNFLRQNGVRFGADGNPIPEDQDKAALYTMDEVNPIDNADFINSRLAAANSAWPEVRKLITYNGAGGGTAEEAMAVLKPTENIVCVNTNTMLDNTELMAAYLNEFKPKWRYPAEIRTGGFELWRWALSTVGPFRRMVFWQQHNNGEDNVLYWNGAYIANNHDIWGTLTLPGSNGVSTGNGNGLLLYPGLPIAEDTKTPIGSLRIKQIAASIEDADYLYLADEFLPEEERPLWEVEAHWTRVDEPAKARYELGNKLEAAATEHSFGSWRIAVRSDKTHDGLEIRECANCGTLESRPFRTSVIDWKGRLSEFERSREDAAFFASYAVDGKFIGVEWRETKAGETTQMSFPVPSDTQEVKLFLTDANGEPLCSSQSGKIKD